MAEREAWAIEEVERAKREAEDDVTKKKGGSFLYVFNRNVIMGVGNGKTDEKSTNNVDKDDVADTASGFQEESNYTDQQNYQRSVYSRQSENLAPTRQNSGTQNWSHNLQPTEGVGNTKDSDETKQPPTRSQILAERAVKIREARERYFKRHGLPSQ